VPGVDAPGGMYRVRAGHRFLVSASLDALVKILLVLKRLSCSLAYSEYYVDPRAGGTSSASSSAIPSAPACVRRSFRYTCSVDHERQEPVERIVFVTRIHIHLILFF
jgi:hypothetical protein